MVVFHTVAPGSIPGMGNYLFTFLMEPKAKRVKLEETFDDSEVKVKLEHEEDDINPANEPSGLMVTPTREQHRARILLDGETENDHKAKIIVPEGFQLIPDENTKFLEIKSTLLATPTLCLSVLFRGNHTSLDEETPIQWTYHVNEKEAVRFVDLKAVAFVPTDSNQPYYLSMTPQDKINEDDVMVTTTEKWALITDILASENEKVLFASKSLLKPILGRFPTAHCTNTFDPQVAAWLIDPELSCGFSFYALCTHYFQATPKTQKLAMPSMHPYAVKLYIEMIECLKLKAHLQVILEKENLLAVFRQQEMQLPPILAKMELRSIKFDNAAILTCEARISERLIELEQLASAKCGFSVPLTSNKKLFEILFTTLKLKLPKDLSKKSAQSTSAATLRAISDQHPLPGIILEHRHLQKLRSTWVHSLDAKLEDGKLYTVWDQLGTATGRISSSKPNLQNIPRAPLMIPHQSPLSIRSAFVAEPGYILVAADYAQLEFRILAHMAQADTLRPFFSSGRDIHRQVAALWRGKDVEDVTNDERETTKRLVYGVLYGMGIESLAEHLEVTKTQAKAYRTSFFEALPTVLEFVESTMQQARIDKSVRTLYDRKRILHPNETDMGKPDRQAVNTKIQGTAADIMKRAMITLEEKIPTVASATLLLQIHDELICQVKVAEKDALVDLLRKAMVEAVGDEHAFDPPLQVHIKTGTSWGDMA